MSSIIKLVWYSPEIDAIVIQVIFDKNSSWEWGTSDLYHEWRKDPDNDPFGKYLWFFLGEL